MSYSNANSLSRRSSDLERFSGNDPVESFRDNVLLLSQFAQAESIELAPYLSSELALFRGLPQSQAQAISAALDEYCKTLSSIKEQREYLKNNLNSIWLTLSKMGLSFPNELFQELVPTDVVEIYSLSGLQVFRSFHFFQFCSFDLETLFCTPWYELFERTPEHETMYMSLFGRLIAGQVLGVEKIQISSHVVRERLCARRSSLAHPRFVAPLSNRAGAVRAYAHVFQVEELRT